MEPGLDLLEGTTIDQYIGGVYVQVLYGNSTEDESNVEYEYHLPIPCKKLVEGTKIEKEADLYLENYMCPDVNMELRG